MKKVIFYWGVIFFKLILTFIPKQKGLILFSSWFGEKYSDSSKIMFEYFLMNHYYNPIWFTRNKALYYELKKKQRPVVYSKSWKGVWAQIRAKMLVSSVQQYDFNMLFYRNCIFLDLDHGYVLKQVGLAIPGLKKTVKYSTKLIRSGMQFWMSAPTDFSMKIISQCYLVDKKRIVHCNKPRADVLFDKDLQKDINVIIDNIKDGRKAIVWMPTNREDGKVPIKVSELINLQKLQDFCNKKNIVFIIKKHFYHRNEIEDYSLYPNIFDITNCDIDSQVILVQADALISDYSSSYIEYLALDRPIILFAYDKDQYLSKERGLFIPFDQITAGEHVYDGDSLLESLERVTLDWYDPKYAEGRKKSRQLYFNNIIKPGHYREEVKSIIDQLLEGKYKSDWGR